MLGRRQIVMGAAATVGLLTAAPFEWRKTSSTNAGFAYDIEARRPGVTVEMGTAVTATTPSGRRVAAP